MGWISGHRFEGSCLVVKLLQGDSPVIIVQEEKDGRNERHDLSGDRIAMGNEVFGVYIFDDFLEDGFSEQ